MKTVTNTGAREYLGYDSGDGGLRELRIPPGVSEEVTDDKARQLQTDFPGDWEIEADEAVEDDKPAEPARAPHRPRTRTRAE